MHYQQRRGFSFLETADAFLEPDSPR